MFGHSWNNVSTLRLHNELCFGVDLVNYDQQEICPKELKNYQQYKIKQFIPALIKL
jgi:hypothetical protein